VLRNILAVIAGSLIWTVMWLGSNAILMSFFPDWYRGRIESVPVLLFTLLRSLIFSIIAGYLTALIAKHQEINCAFALGVLQLALGIFFTVQFYESAPLWYHLLFLTLLIPGNLLGGQLRIIQRGRVVRGSIRAV